MEIFMTRKMNLGIAIFSGFIGHVLQIFVLYSIGNNTFDKYNDVGTLTIILFGFGIIYFAINVPALIICIICTILILTKKVKNKIIEFISIFCLIQVILPVIVIISILIGKQIK
jgi:hypothetical protein